MELAEELLEQFNEVLRVTNNFNFPFPPYDIQEDFMHNLFEVIEGKKLGIFESPTGTGKSLSVICGSLAWLRDHEEREKRILERCVAAADVSSSDSSDWLTAQAADIGRRSAKLILQNRLTAIEHRKRDINAAKKSAMKKDEFKKQTQNFTKKSDDNPAVEVSVKEVFEEEDVLLEETESKREDALSDDDEETEGKEESRDTGIKIIFCSRTHSQLSQFVSEIKRTVYKENIRVVPLASRQSYCINPYVRALGSQSLINERCIEMQRKGKGKTTAKSENGERLKKRRNGTSSCPYLGGARTLGEQLAVTVSDVEDVVSAGQAADACPYYAARTAAASFAQVVVVPYQTLLHKGTREASGLSIDNNVVIIDEAHNLLDTITHVHSVTIQGSHLTQAYSQLTQYRDRYEKKFSAYNLMYLKQLIYVTGNMIKLLGGKPGCGPNEATAKVLDSKMHTVVDFLITAEIDNFNMYDIIKFCHSSKITHKMQGFTAKYLPFVNTKPAAPTGIKAFLKEITNKNTLSETTPTEESTAPEEDAGRGQALVSVVAFLEALTNHCADGRVSVNRGSILSRSYIKYLLLNPAPTFADIVAKARSVIVCGGTMEPIEEFKDRLFAACGAPTSRIVHFACGHVIPPENILPIAVASGPTGKPLDFSFQSRSTYVVINEVGRILSNVCQIVPGGVVCFFPSYEYESTVFQYLEKNGVISNISTRKKIMREPKKTSDVDKVLSEYAAVIKNCAKNTSGVTGCLLFSVVGGKLSEGLNFSDDLGRCVMVVGLPYPNIKSPELQEKMTYLDNNVGPAAGRDYYEALCMKAVNQCIGRAVRHRNDYATVLLLDHRYHKPHIQKQLPSWIQRSLVSQEKFGPTIAMLTKFFKSRQ